MSSESSLRWLCRWRLLSILEVSLEESFQVTIESHTCNKSDNDLHLPAGPYPAGCTIDSEMSKAFWHTKVEVLVEKFN